ncbi:hypothetical protein AJ80_05724 [Polytolypa hystricis UAMH7299]|uniref:Uncharacterized protein n=1 Tax=Polytolypa hystricis (strain UAMH7299) TaxID=1447883 RepID=A0A2B7Y1P8_POLH7|nr:hypothetical protein AJ80_05724 [Polytolypa hystricis UAMH7299]
MPCLGFEVEPSFYADTSHVTRWETIYRGEKPNPVDRSIEEDVCMYHGLAVEKKEQTIHLRSLVGLVCYIEWPSSGALLATRAENRVSSARNGHGANGARRSCGIQDGAIKMDLAVVITSYDNYPELLCACSYPSMMTQKTRYTDSVVLCQWVDPKADLAVEVHKSRLFALSDPHHMDL